MIHLKNERNFKNKQELILFNIPMPEPKGISKHIVKLTITEAHELLVKLQQCIMNAESNNLISTFLRNNGMDEAQIETAISQLNKLREKL